MAQGETDVMRTSVASLQSECRGEQVLNRVCVLRLGLTLDDVWPTAQETGDEYLMRCREAMKTRLSGRSCVLISHPHVVDQARVAVNAAPTDVVMVLMFPNGATTTLNYTQLGGALSDSLIMEYERSVAGLLSS